MYVGFIDYACRLALMWTLSSGDITITIKNVCLRLLHDKSASNDVLHRRAEGLLQLGKIFSKMGAASADKALTSFMEVMDTRTGFFNMPHFDADAVFVEKEDV